MIRLASFASLVLVAAVGRAQTVDHEFRHDAVMGTSLELTIRAESTEQARAAEARVLAEIDRLSAIFSTYDPGSELSRWLAGPPGVSHPSAELVEVLRLADRWREATGGAFDPRVRGLGMLWKACESAGREPTDDEIAAVHRASSAPAWRIGAEPGAVERLSTAPITLDAIAKGYIVEHACEAALRGGEGVRGVLLNVGGDLRVAGDLEGSIALSRPRAGAETLAPLTTITVRNRAVATSGGAHRGFEVAGRRRSHIVDPRTGRPAEVVASATVVAPRSADADALATALNVLSSDEGLALVDGLDAIECLIVTTDGREFRSAGFAALETDAAEPSKRDPTGHWADEFELAVGFEINRPDDVEGRRYRRPYVVVWVEDAEGRPVRTLLLWVSQGGAGPGQWLPDLKRWFPKNKEQRKLDKVDLVYSIAQPTRPPGTYSVIWDGFDNRKQPLPAGTYTIHVEAAREHGTYQDIRKSVTLGDEPFALTLDGNIEIKQASIEYRRKPEAR